jgi:hypothetical protein
MSVYGRHVIKRGGKKFGERGVCPREALVDGAIVVKGRLCMVVEAGGLDHIHHDHPIFLRLRALEDPMRLNPFQGGQEEVSGELRESDQRRGGTHRPPAAGTPSGYRSGKGTGEPRRRAWQLLKSLTVGG